MTFQNIDGVLVCDETDFGGMGACETAIVRGTKPPNAVVSPAPKE